MILNYNTTFCLVLTNQEQKKNKIKLHIKWINNQNEKRKKEKKKPELLTSLSLCILYLLVKTTLVGLIDFCYILLKEK